MSRPAVPIELTPAEDATLRAWRQSRTLPVRHRHQAFIRFLKTIDAEPPAYHLRSHMRPVILAVVLLAACGDSQPESSATRTPEQQRAADSALGVSGIPGAAGVTRALTASDSMLARQARIDSIAGTP